MSGGTFVRAFTWASDVGRGDSEDPVMPEWMAFPYLPIAGPGPPPKLLKMLISERQLSEREQQLLEKSSELQALQKETDSMRADFSLLRNQFLTERKKAEKQVASLKEALKIQRSQLEKNLLVSTHCPGSS